MMGGTDHGQEERTVPATCHGIQLRQEVYPDNMLIGITVTGTAEDGTYVELKQDIQMNYCPVCGRKCGW